MSRPHAVTMLGVTPAASSTLATGRKTRSFIGLNAYSMLMLTSLCFIVYCRSSLTKSAHFFVLSSSPVSFIAAFMLSVPAGIEATSFTTADLSLLSIFTLPKPKTPIFAPAAG